MSLVRFGSRCGNWGRPNDCPQGEQCPGSSVYIYEDCSDPMDTLRCCGCHLQTKRAKAMVPADHSHSGERKGSPGFWYETCACGWNRTLLTFQGKNYDGVQWDQWRPVGKALERALKVGGLTPQEMLAHLLEHRAEGDHVPERVFRALRNKPDDVLDAPPSTEEVMAAMLGPHSNYLGGAAKKAAIMFESGATPHEVLSAAERGDLHA